MPSSSSITSTLRGRARGQRFTVARAGVVLTLLTVALVVSVAVGLTVGSTHVSLLDLLQPSRLGAAGVDPATIVLEVRLPRVLLAVAVGAGLSAAGVCFQALLRNPLADPYILGISGGAGLGSILASVLAPAVGTAVLFVRPLSAFVGSLAAVGFLLLLARRRGRILPETMILMGVVVNATIMAAIIFIITMTDFSRYAGTMYWLMGSLSSPSMAELSLLFFCLAVGIGTLSFLGQGLNVLAGGEEQASQLGLNVPRVRMAALMAGSLMTAAAVALSGLTGFVGLMVPHLCRAWLGPDNRLLVSASALTGAIILVIADTGARALFAPTQIPVGVITALFGGPCFLWLFARQGAAGGRAA
ncbi:MAG TPA: iron ABC transporter permease [Candidatus Polarisedimenticolia bacterium]|nr:iron ABC transporter permease [Candidatus Polarisedimenticolia bacterium]